MSRYEFLPSSSPSDPGWDLLVNGGGRVPFFDFGPGEIEALKELVRLANLGYQLEQGHLVYGGERPGGEALESRLPTKGNPFDIIEGRLE